MATTTPNFGWSVPTSTDYVKDGATAIETLGDAIDARLGNVGTYPNQIVNVVSGVSRPIAYAMAAGSATTNGSGLVTVTFPSSRFTQTPLITATTNTSPNNSAIVMYYSASTTGATFYCPVASMPLAYIAVQMTSAASAG